MIKKLFVSAAFIGCLLNSFAQSADTTEAPKFIQYVGFQANQLLKQIINLNNSSAVVDNPYLLTYSIFFTNCGWGLETGIGYNYFDTKNADNVKDESKSNDLSFRLGICKRVKISKRFEAGYGLDLVLKSQADVTVSTSTTVAGNFTDSTSSTATTKTTGYGIGPQLYLGFNITRRLLLGTELTYYYMSTTLKQNVVTMDVQTQSGFPVVSTTSNSNSEVDTKSFSFSFPTVLFLILKF